MSDTPSKLAWNTEGEDLNNRRDIIRNELMSYRANWQFFLGDMSLAMDVLPYVSIGEIYRVFDPFHEWTPGSTFDNTFWQKHSPEQIIAWLKANIPPEILHNPKMRWSVGNNEPATEGRTAEFVRWCVKLADLGKQADIRFAIAEIATAKSVWHDEVIAGLWDDLIRVMDEYRGFHIFTIHEYTTGILPACLLPDYPLNLDNPEQLKQSNWQNAKINLSSIEGNYHVGRGLLVSHVRAKEIGIEPIPFVVAECAFDWNADVVDGDERQRVVGNLRSTFWTDPHHDALRGSTGHQHYHEWVMQKTGFQGDWNDYLFEQYEWLVNAYPDECEGLQIFALNHDWDIPEGHDMSHPRNDKFRQLVISKPLGASTVTNPIDPSQYTMEAKIISTKSVTNIRDKHDATRGKVIYTLQGQDTLEVMISDVPLWEDDNKNFFWYRIEYNGQELFVADTKNLVRSDVPVTPPVDNPDTPDTPTSPPDGISEAQLNEAVQTAVTAQFEALQAKVDELEAQIAEMLTPVMVDVPDVTYTLPKWAIPMKVAELKGEIRQREAQVIFLEGTPTPPATAQTLNPLTDNLPPAELDAQSFKPTLDDIDFQELNIPDMSVDTQGVVTFTNEPDDDTNEQTLTDIMLNGNDMPKHQIHFDEDDNRVQGTGDDDSEVRPDAA